MEKSIKNTKTIVYVYGEADLYAHYHNGGHIHMCKIGETTSSDSDNPKLAVDKRINAQATAFCTKFVVFDIFEFPYKRKTDTAVHTILTETLLVNSSKKDVKPYCNNGEFIGEEWFYNVTKQLIWAAVNLVRYSYIVEHNNIKDLLFSNNAYVVENDDITENNEPSEETFEFNGSIGKKSRVSRMHETIDWYDKPAHNHDYMTHICIPKLNGKRKNLSIIRYIYGNDGNYISYKYNEQETQKYLEELIPNSNWKISDVLSKKKWSGQRISIDLNISKYSPEQVEEIKNILINEFC